MREFGEWRFSRDLRARFTGGDLAEEWVERHPTIFDALDVAQVRNQPKNHFYEWLSAVLILESTGYLSLIEKYQFPKHRRKQRILQELAGEEVFDWLTKSPRPCQGPDLLVFQPDFTRWYFVEVKGPTDRLRPVQGEYFREFEERTNKPVHAIRLREVRA